MDDRAILDGDQIKHLDSISNRSAWTVTLGLSLEVLASKVFGAGKPTDLEQFAFDLGVREAEWCRAARDLLA